MDEPTKTVPRRRRFTLSLRRLMVLVLIVGGVLGWKARRASIQRRAVEAIKNAGGMVQYDYQFAGDQPLSPSPAHPYPAWLRGPIGDEYFQEPASVYILGSPKSGGEGPTDAGIAALTSLDHVHTFQSVRVPVSNAGFARLAGMPRLKVVSLADIDVTDDGLASVGWFPALESLCLRVRSEAITARGVEFIGRQPRLKSLVLAGVSLLEPSSFAPLAGLTRLDDLEIPGSPQDDACLEHLRGLTAMKTLCLRRTSLTDAGVERLSAMSQLECLEFDASTLSDAGFKRLLKDHPKLKEIYLGPAPNLTDSSLATASIFSDLTYLNLQWSNVTDLGLGRFRGSKLNGLSVSGEGVTDASIAGLAASIQFTNLGLGGTHVDGSGFAWLANQASLGSMWLDGSLVGDQAMAALATAPILESLSLRDTELTDAGLATLQSAPSLRYLDVRRTRVTEAGLAAFRKARPGVVLPSGPIDSHP